MNWICLDLWRLGTVCQKKRFANTPLVAMSCSAISDRSAEEQKIR